jgi:non-ribosomal peptide synthetase component E (peptide arylation enzyme)
VALAFVTIGGKPERPHDSGTTGEDQSDMTAPWDWLQLPAPHHRRYAESGAWANVTIADLAEQRAADDPDGIAFIAGDTRMSWSQVLNDARALAVSLRDLGLVPGDVVSFQTPNWTEAAIINLAAALSGLLINPIVPIYRDAEVGMMLTDSRSKAFITAASFRNYDYGAMAERLRPSLPDLKHIIIVRGEGALTLDGLIAAGRNRPFDRPNVDPGGVKMLLFTSGTTGRPKAVLHSHNTLNRVLTKSCGYWGVGAGDTILMPSPVTHISGYANGLEKPFVIGTTTVLMESWNAADAVALIDRHQVAGAVAATPFLIELAKVASVEGKTLPSFRFFACGGAAVPPDVIPAANRAFENCKAFRVFGSSEAPLVTYGYPDAADERLAATTDGAIVDYDVRIVDDEGQDVPQGSDGEILARGPAMFLGYADQRQTGEAITEDGYFRTGDIGCITPEGALLITGRKKDLIIRGGENISAKEIEDVLHAHPAVNEASVVAMPHPRLGEGVCAYIILKPGTVADAPTLARHVEASGLAKQKIPERFEFVDDLPRTASGKVRKDQLRLDIKSRLETA